MDRLITRFLIALGFMLATGTTGYARMMPMPMSQSVAMAGICLHLGCNDQHIPGHVHHGPMAANCIAAACAGVVALPVHRAAIFQIIDAVMIYHPLASSSRTGIRPAPDAPPPRPLSLI